MVALQPLSAIPRRNMEVRGNARILWDSFKNPATAPLEIGLWGCAGSGKSWDIILFLCWVMHKYPKVPGRIAICRQTHRSLAASACVTMRKILPHGHPSLEGAGDNNRLEYRFGAWTVGLFGLLNPGNLYSTEWDIVYVQEARDVGASAWEQFGRGMRNDALYLHDAQGNPCEPGKGVLAVPWCPKLLDTNPDTLESWMLKRQERQPDFRFLQMFEQDNPAYWDRALACRTPRGAAFRRHLDMLTGIRRDRLRDAIWGSSEGVIWPEFTRARHGVHIKRDADGFVGYEELKKLKITEFYAGVDFGIDNAGVLLVGGLTSDRKLIILHEVYHTGMGVDWWAGKFAEANKHYPLSLAFCDHNRKDWMWAFNEAIGRSRDGADAVAVLADKGIDRGLEIVRRRFIQNTLLFEADCLSHDPDQALVERMVPWETQACISEYVRKRNPRTDDENDDGKSRIDQPDKSKPNTDGPDALRYLCVGVELVHPSMVLVDPRDIAQQQRIRKRMKDAIDHLHAHAAPWDFDGGLDDLDGQLVDLRDAEIEETNQSIRDALSRFGVRSDN